MLKSSAPNAVLVKKHNKMKGKKWLLNMDFLRIWETGVILELKFQEGKDVFNNHITR